MDSILSNRLIEAVGAFDTAKVLVVGDVMLDHYIFGDSERISPEAPVPVVKVERDVYHLGGAANVAKNISSLGGGALLCGIIGVDGPGDVFKGLLRHSEIQWIGHEDPKRPTIQKVRILARGQQLLRVDREETSSVGGDGSRILASNLKAALGQVSCIVVSDYAKGLVGPEIMAMLKEAAKGSGVLLIVDPKPVNAHLYSGVDLVTPNRREAEEMIASFHATRVAGLDGLMEAIRDALDLEALLVTLGEKGMAILEGSRVFHLPTMAREVYDVTGAGDTVIAILSLALSVGLDLKEAGYLANIGAGLVVGKIGTATIGPSELIEGVKRALE